MLRIFSFLGIGLLVLSAAGCGVKAQTYSVMRERVDIDQQGGNAGYLGGNGQYQEPSKKTRKVYVLELTKPVSEAEAKKIEQEVTTTTHETTNYNSSSNISQEQESLPQDIVSRQQASLAVEQEPEAQQPAAAVTGPTSAVNYVIVKDDTLQKISKKFYNTYGKWIKIYEANKDKIKNPNLLKAGVEIVIPPAE